MKVALFLLFLCGSFSLSAKGKKKRRDRDMPQERQVLPDRKEQQEEQEQPNALEQSLIENLKGSNDDWDTFEPNQDIKELIKRPTVEEFLERIAMKATLERKLTKLSFNEFINMLPEEAKAKIIADIERMKISKEELENIHWEISDSPEEVSVRLIQQYVDPLAHPDPDRKKWRIQVYGGIASVQSMLAIIGGDSTRHVRYVGVAGFEVARELYHRIFGTNWDVELSLGASRYIERDQEDGNSINASVKFVYKTSVYGNRMNFAIGEGLSYALDNPPSFEDTNEMGEQSKLLNYITIEAGINMGDLFKNSFLSNCMTGLKIVHRSGVFGSIDAFGNVYGGSNFMTAFVECRR